jgi:hypothetical protein
MINTPDMKTILLAIITMVVSLSCTLDNTTQTSTNGKLTGIVHYKDAYRPSDLFDAGCEIYAINVDEVKSTKFNDFTTVIENFHRNKAAYAKATYNTVDPARIKEAQENFNTVSDFTSQYISGFKKLASVVRVETNSDGSYSLNLKPGKYYLLLVSGTIKSDNPAESDGNIGYKIAEIKTNGQTKVDACFEKHEVNWFMFLINLAGC